MARRPAISTIINELPKIKKKEEKMLWLRKHDSAPLRQILRIAYDDERVELLIPNTPPPWKKNSYFDVENMLYGETRRLKIFIRGGGYDNLNPIKRESLFISLLEDIDNNDAELLVKMIQQKPFKGLTHNQLEETFPNIYETRLV